jgi:hypothetical protein
MNATFELLQDTADPAPAGSCGAPASGEGNYTYGYGYLNVLAAGQQVCSAGTITGSVTSGSSPVEGATVTADNGAGVVIDALTGADGIYTLNAPAGIYTVTATKYGYDSDVETGVGVVEGEEVTVNFTITPLPSTTVSGVVYDAGVEELALHGYPLYASIHISASGFDQTIYSDPITGVYSIDLVSETEHTFEVTSVISGYEPLVETVTPTTDALTHDIGLGIDGEVCAAPGYGSSCEIIPGGAVAGYITDEMTAEPLVGAVVYSETAATVSFVLEDDPDNAGIYWLFQPTETDQQDVLFTASKALYADETATVSVMHFAVEQQDFTLHKNIYGTYLPMLFK